MIDNPYKVLGVSENATQDEIKKAYRRKSKECHPDLHPDDKDASRKMNEVNEAYAILTSPEKLDSWKREQAANSYSNTYSNSYGGQYGQGQYQQRKYQQRQYNGGGYTTWTTTDSFEDLFNMFMGAQSNVDTTPHRSAGDSAEIGQAIDAINRRDYMQAQRILVNVPSYERNARWYYLSALANNGSGNTTRAQEFIRKAVELEQSNQVYRSLYRQYYGRGGFTGGYTGNYSGGNNGDNYNRGQNYQQGRYYKTSNGGCLRTMIRFGLIMLALDILFKVLFYGGMGGYPMFY